MERSWIVLMTVFQAVILTTLAATSVNPVETTNNYRQVKARSRASEHRSGQLQVLAQVSTDRTFTRQPKPQKRADYRRPSPTVNDSVQQQQQQQQQQHHHHQHRQQQQYGAAMSHLDWTPIMQPKEPLQKDYQQRQIRQPDAVVTFVTPQPQALPTTMTHYKYEPSPKNHVQHLDDEIDEFRNLYRYVNASELSEGYNNKHRNVTHITNTYGAVDEYRKNSNFGFHGGVLENKTRSQNSDSNNGVYGAKGQNKLSPQDVYNTDGESDEENNERPPKINHLDFQLDPHRNALNRIVNTDVLLLQLQANENNKHNDQVDSVNPVDQRTQIRYGDSQHLHLLDGESKSADVLRDYPSNTTTAATYPMSIFDQGNSHAELYDDHNYIVYNTNDDVANEQRLNHKEGVDDVSNDFYRYDNPKYANANGEVDGRGNGTHHDYAIVHTDSSKAKKHEDGRKLYVNNLKLDLQDAPKNKQRVSSNRHANMNVTTAAELEADSHVLTYKRPWGHNDERGEIDHRRRQKPSVNGGRAEANPTIPTTTSARPLRRKAQSSAQTRRTAAEDDKNDDGTGGRTLYSGQNGHERKHNLNDRGRITPPSDKQPSSTTSLAHVIEQDVIDGDDDYIATEEELEQVEQGGYGFGYTVLDENVGMDFGQWERREPGRTGTVTGLYRLRLPDGRTQTVKYTVSPATGYRASVTYEGIQRHPAATPSPRPVKGAETRSPD
ncbi:uncharacterized protein LOC132943009 [Metopolophium dirhodum]|uniref:uncharacterized protein LOC132943009 n=1 Tax=Metopolophium dirhodum TaxID=44670 RepID=UPI00298FCCBF|nr:uncharacterized protein LOC132943009 [Metopolophium dirhodum]